jgi:hypothetical protein
MGIRPKAHQKGVKWKERFTNAHEAYQAGYHWCGAKPCEPTRFSPGTFEKVFLMRARYWAGQDLHHAEDGNGGFMGTPLLADLVAIK